MAKSYGKYGDLLAKLSVYAKGGIIGVDAVKKGIDVAHAPQGQRARVGFVKGAEFVGEVLGAFAGELIIGITLPESLGASLIEAPAVIVGTSAAGGYAAEWAAEGIENKYDSLTKRCES